jgi:hypothetical protein
MIRSIVLLIFGGMLLLMAIRNLRRQQLKEKYALLFAVTALPFLTLAIWPDGIVYISDLTGIEKPTIMVMSLSIFALLTIFKLLRIVSMQDRKISTLAQEIALLKNQVAGSPAAKPDGNGKPANPSATAHTDSATRQPEN